MGSSSCRWIRRHGAGSRCCANLENCDVAEPLPLASSKIPTAEKATAQPTRTSSWRLTGVPAIDVLLTGHTHEDIPPRLVRGVLVAQPLARAQMLTRIDLRLERDGQGWHITERRGDNLPVKGVAADPELTSAFTLVQQRVQTALDAPVGEVTDEVRVDRCRLQDCAAVDLLHEVQMRASGADLSLAALLNPGAPVLHPGSVNWRWIHAFYVYPNTLLAVRLDGRPDPRRARARGPLLRRSRVRSRGMHGNRG